MPADTVTFACVGCGKRYHAPAAAQGRKTRCKRCGAELTVPPPKPSAETPELVGFNCPLCDTRMHAPVSRVGARVRCPDCYRESVVPPPPPPEKPRRPAAMDGQQYELDDGEAGPAEAPPAYVAFVCRKCQTHLTAAVDRVGEPVACPDCGAQTPAPPPPRATLKPGLAADSYEVEEAAPEPTPAAGLYEQYAASPPAGFREDRGERGRGSGSRAARGSSWWDRQFGYTRSPGYLGVALAMSVEAKMTAIAGGATLAAAAGWRVGVTVSINWLLPMMALGVCATAVTFFALAAYASALLSSAAGGATRVERWPDADFAAWFADGLRWLTALGSAIAVGGVITAAGGLAGPVATAVCAASVWLALPWTLLSQMDTESAWGVCSPRIARTLRHAPLAWTRFYLRTAFGGAVLIAAGAGVARWAVPAALVVLAPWVAVNVLHYAWLLGRLAYVAGEATPDVHLGD